MSRSARVVAFCGKGGAGKTAVCAMTARALLDAGVGSILLVDADPVFGLAAAVGVEHPQTIGQVRERVVRAARNRGVDGAREVADSLDYLVLETLVERGPWSFLAMGHTETIGCFCSVNKLLRQCLEPLARSFSYVLLDAEAGIEQINRQVVRDVDLLVAVADPSQRAIQATAMVGAIGSRGPGPSPGRIGLLINKVTPEAKQRLAELDMPQLPMVGELPDDPSVRRFDLQGRPLLELPESSDALQAVKSFVRDHVMSTTDGSKGP